MKRIVLILCLALCLPCLAMADGRFYAAPAAGGSCATEGQVCTGETSPANMDLYNWYYRASKSTATETATICKISLNPKKVGSPTNNYRVALFTDSAGSPGTIVGSWSDWSSSAALATDYAYVDLTKTGGLGAGKNSGTAYWRVIQIDAYSDGSNYISFLSSTDCDGGEIKSSDNLSSWTTWNDTVGLLFKDWK